jgi:nitrogen fixation protein FixH
MTITETSTPHDKSTGRFWALFPVVLLGSSLLGLGTLASIAMRDPSFALERDYYQRAVRFEDEQAQRAENQRLGYQLELEVHPAADRARLVLTLSSKHGAPLPSASLRAEAFANARAADIREVEFRLGADGRYHAELDREVPGLWEFRVVVVNGPERFTAIVRRDVPRAGRAP